MNTNLIKEKITAIEAEMKRIGLWQAESLPESAYEMQEAFGADTMTLSQWLQFIFIPRIQELLKTDGPWPSESEVGIYAAQQFLFLKPDSSGTYSTQGSIDRKESNLVQLLQEFDSLFIK